MKSTGNADLNSRTYWNQIYGDEVARATYDAQGTDAGHLNISKGVVSTVKTNRFQFAANHVKDGDKVLDIGCGVGTFTHLVKTANPKCEIWGTDISDTAIEANKLVDPDINYSHGYVGELKHIPEDYFDIAFCGETIEHLQDPSILFKEAFQKLKKGGKLIITTPKEEHIDSEEHLWYFKQEDVDKLFTDNGFTNVKFEYLPDMEHLLIIFCSGEK